MARWTGRQPPHPAHVVPYAEAGARDPQPQPALLELIVDRSEDAVERELVLGHHDGLAREQGDLHARGRARLAQVEAHVELVRARVGRAGLSQELAEATHLFLRGQHGR
eukprot:CAMPEP_0206014502 /NCGR_PEP_ID=MMETSP1464-20131121/18429_1 /ASSEMBLY_ACC=CAM_ASM_001124 /TAXON_ID=119497 /ORGANISM="Exanthemachrysis gayraliae, Strain RCC1523" /LENGTH=108 /DNA_ID=CAMNT_0053388261 /DNA_START=237 /DNA_END=559 /DNA_ORIENTATION=+